MREAVQFQRSLVSVTGGLLATIPVVAVLGGVLALGDTVPAVTMGAGAMLVGIAWRTTGGRPPLAVMATDAAIMGLSTFIGCVTGSILWLHLIVLCLWSGAGGLLVGLGNRGGVIGTQAIIAVAVFGRFSEPAPAALGLAGLVLAGGAAQVMFLSLVRWPLPLRGQRAATAAAYRSLARLADADDDASSLPTAGLLDEAESSLASSSLFGDAAVMTLRTLVSEGHRLRVVLTALRALRRQQRARIAARIAARIGARIAADADVDADIDRALALTANALAVAAGSIEGNGGEEELAAVAGELSAVAEHADATVREVQRADGVSVQGARRLQALAGQLRAIATLAPAAGRAGGLHSRRRQARTDEPIRQLRRDLAQLRDHASLHAPAGRHALRLGIVVPLAALLVRVLPVQRGYWVVVAAATVLRPEYGATLTRGTERALGTSLGVALAGLISVAVHPAGGVIVLLVGALGWAGYALFPASFAAGFAFVTALVVFLLNAISPDTLATAGARLLDTLIGGAIGLAVYALWPTWAHGPAWQAVADLVAADRAYLDGVLAALVQGRRADDRELRPLSRAARRARTNAESAVARSLSEPTTRRIDPARSQGALGALRRLVQAAHILRLDVSDDRERHPIPPLAPLRRDLDRLLETVERTLRDGGQPLAEAPTPDVRERFGALRREIGSSADAQALLSELDEIVDAADGLAATV